MTKKIPENLTKIFVEHGVIVRMASELKVSRDLVGDALNATKTTKMGNLIREIAVRFYGGLEQKKSKIK